MSNSKFNIMHYCFLMLAILFLILLNFIPATAGPNTCSLGEVINFGELSFSIQILIENSDTLAGFQIPFGFAYGDIGIQCDSISFHGGDCQDFSFQDVKIDNPNRRAYLSAINNIIPEDEISPLLPGNHVIVLAYFSIDQLDSAAVVMFTNEQFPDETRDYSFMFWTPLAETVSSDFSLGTLKLQ